MRFTELLTAKNEHPANGPIPTITFLGDSVTQGCFELYLTENGTIDTIVDQDAVYHVDLQSCCICFGRIVRSISSMPESAGTAHRVG